MPRAYPVELRESGHRKGLLLRDSHVSIWIFEANIQVMARVTTYLLAQRYLGK
jgi:hypothetical protein